MATYQSNKVSATVLHRAGIDVTSVTGEYTVSSNLATNDIIEMVKIPAGARIIDVIASASASVGATATAVVGDQSDTDRFIASGQLGQGAAQLSRLNAATGNGYQYSAEDTIDITYTSIATPATSGVLKLTALYTMQS